MHFSKTLLLTIAAAGPQMVQSQQGLPNVRDIGIPSSCTGSSCCTPGCEIQIYDTFGCTGAAQIAGSCASNYNQGTITVGVNGCDSSISVSWQTPSTEGGEGILEVYGPNGQAYGYYISNCQPASEGGSQCAPTGGGCTTSTSAKRALLGAKFRA